MPFQRLGKQPDNAGLALAQGIVRQEMTAGYTPFEDLYGNTVRRVDVDKRQAWVMLQRKCLAPDSLFDRLTHLLDHLLGIVRVGCFATATFT